MPFLQNSLGRLGFVFDRTGEIVHSPLFGDYRKSPGVAQAVREYTRARVRATSEPGATERSSFEALETSAASEGGDNTARRSSEPQGETLPAPRAETDSGLSDPGARQDFHAAVSAAAQAQPTGMIEVKAPEFYANPDTRLFLSPDRTAGAAVTSDGLLVSAFGAPADLKPILAAAAEHATRVNAYAVNKGARFATYAEAGFRPVARVLFDPRYAPDGWPAALGTPDLVFMVKDPNGLSGGPPLRGPYANIEHKVPRVRSRDEALRWQADAIKAATIAPVSRALDIQVVGSHAPDVELGVSAVDQVHRDGALPKIPIENYLNPKSRELGMFDVTITGTPVRILVRDIVGYWPALTTVHEIGHFLDYWVLGKQGQYASASHPELQAFRDAVDNSQAVKRLRESVDENAGLLLRKELWARAYAQYVARKSGNPRMLEQVTFARKTEAGRQWEDWDFIPIEKAIDKLFKKKGWRE